MTDHQEPVTAPARLDLRIAAGFEQQRAHRAALPADPVERRRANSGAALDLARRLRQTNPGYARLWARHEGDGPPVLERAFLTEHFDEFAAGTSLTARQASAFAAAPFRLGSRYDRDHLVFGSSGSSGRPLPVGYAVTDFGRTLEAFLSRAVLAARPAARSLLYIGLMDRHNGGNAWMHYLGGALRTVLADVFAPVTELVGVLDRVRPDVLVTRPHLLRALGEQAARCGVPLPAAHLVSVGEPLGAEQRAEIARRWSSPPHNSYSTVETGPLGYQSDPDQDTLTLYDDLHHVELLDAAGAVVTEPGRPGRVVVTTLYRRTLPLVRYRVGDVAAWADPTCSGLTFPLGRDGQVLRLRVRGRQARLPELALWSLRADGLRQYQVVQTGADALLVRCELADAACWSAVDREVRTGLTRLVQEHTGLAGVRVRCERVAALLPDRATGKISRVRPLPVSA